MQILHSGVKSGQKYSEKVRHFCLALVYYSPRAYEHVRKTFHNHLPHIQTIRTWFANSDIRSDPGLQTDHIKRLKKIAAEYENKNGRKVMCSLVFDEMYIRQQALWCSTELNFSGFANDAKGEEKKIAKQVIAFILKGIDVNFEFPIAYYFIDEIKAPQRKNLVQEIIAAVTQCGVKITNLTFDGLSANAAMCRLSGANLNVYHRDFQTHIINPITKEKIYIMLDPCHMVKLVRNTLGRKQEIFVGSKNKKIEWRYIESLYEYSRNNNVYSHKLTKKHIEWKRNSMNVRLATQTLSNSVADSIQFLQENNVPEFQGAETSIEFFRRIDKTFNIFNSRNLRHSQPTDIFKRVLSEENKRIVFDFLHSNIKYFKSLKIHEDYYEGKKKSATAIKKTKMVPILKSRSFCGFRGFIIDMVSLMDMFTEYIEQNHILTSIATYNMLQDVIEMFFGRIRACGGFNNNPNVHQFKGIYISLKSTIYSKQIQPN